MFAWIWTNHCSLRLCGWVLRHSACPCGNLCSSWCDVQGGKFLKTCPASIAMMVIRVKLFIAELYKTKDSCYRIVTEIFRIGCLHGAHSVSSFYDFQKISFCNFMAFFFFLTQSNLYFFQMFLLNSIKAYLCPNINFDGVDFSECRSEEVISFFWCSVYVNANFTLRIV